MDWLSIVPVFYRWVFTLLFAGIIVALSITPGIDRPGDSFLSWLVVNTAKPIQKAMHFGVYAILALLWMWALESIDSRVSRIALAFVATAGLGAVLEWHQTRIPGRFGTVADVLLNALGAVAGLIVAALLM